MNFFKSNHLLIVCIVSFFEMSGGALLGPVLPVLVESLHTTRHEVGMVIAVYTFSTALFTLIIGHLADRVSHKKILIPCLVINGIAGLASYFTPNLQTLLVLRFIQGIGVAGMMPMAMIIIGDMYSGLDRVHAMSKISMTNAIGAISAPLIGGGLAAISWNYPFLFYVMTLPLALIVSLFLPETKTGTPNERTGPFNAFNALKDYKILYTVFLIFAVFFLLYTLVIYIPFMLKDSFGFTSKEAGLALSVQGIAVVLIAPHVKKLATRFSMILLVCVGFAFSGIAIAAIPWVHSVTAIILLLFLFGAGFGLSQTIINTQIIQIAPKDSVGNVVSIFITMKFLGQTLAPVVLAIVLLRSNLAMVFTLSGFFGLCIAITTYLMRKRLQIKNTG